MCLDLGGHWILPFLDMVRFAKDLPQHVHGLARCMVGSPILLKPYFLPVFSSELLYLGLHHGLEHVPISFAPNCSGRAVLVVEEVGPNDAVMSYPTPDGDLLGVSLCHTVRMGMLLGPDAAVLLIHEATEMEVSLVRHDEPVAVCLPRNWRRNALE